MRFHTFEILEVATRKRSWEAKFLSTSKALARACLDAESGVQDLRSTATAVNHYGVHYGRVAMEHHYGNLL